MIHEEWRVIKGLKNYGSIPHLSTSKLTDQADKKIDIHSEEILTKTGLNGCKIIVTEKIDGSNVGIIKYHNKLYGISRNGYKVTSSDFKYLKLFQDYIDAKASIYDKLLEEGERIAGEWMIKQISLKYNIKGDPFIAFDIFDKENNRLLYENFKERCDSLKIETTHLVNDDKSPISIEDAMNKLGDHGFHGCLEKPEGIVYRCEDKKKVKFLAKFVRDGKIDGQYLKEDLYNNFSDWR